MTRVLVAADLDRTLIYSRGALDTYGHGDEPLVAVERYEGRDASWMTSTAASGLAALAGEALFVPATTRTPEQWQRITLPGPPAPFVITANGGVLVVDGEIDRSWDRRVQTELARVAPLDEIWQHAARVCRPEWTVKLRNARGLFCYAVLHRKRLPAGFLAETAAWARERGWQLSLQGRKLYWVPDSLTKSAAAAEIAARTGRTRLLAAGDSLLDRDLLEAADTGIMARHGELADSGWTARHVAVTTALGVQAGEEIVDWLRSRAAQPRGSESQTRQPSSTPPGTTPPGS